MTVIVTGEWTEVWVPYYKEHEGMEGGWSLDDFRRKGIDTGRPFQLHTDKTGGVVKARQKKWTGTDEW